MGIASLYIMPMLITAEVDVFGQNIRNELNTYVFPPFWYGFSILIIFEGTGNSCMYMHSSIFTASACMAASC